MIGTLSASRTGGLRRPAVFASIVFLVSSVAIALTPYLGGEAGAAAMLFVTGATNGLGNVTILTVLQKWAPPAMLGRVMSALMLCAFGSFPLSVAVSGVLVRHIGPSLFFPVAGGVVAVAILGGLTQREFREFGAGGASWGKYSHGTGGAGAGLKRLDVRLKRKKPQPSAAGTRGTAGSCDKAALVSNAALGSRK